MNEPKRWSELTGEALPEESELLRAGMAERMPSELRGQVWSAIALAAAGGAAATALGAASAAAHGSAAIGETAASAAVASKGLVLSLSTVIKGVIAVAVLGGVGVGAVHVQSSRSTRAASPPLLLSAAKASREATSAVGLGAAEGAVSAIPSAAPAPTNVPVHPAPVAASPRSPSTSVASRAESDAAQTRPSEGSAGSDVASRLREESAAVLAIRRTLLAGNAREALSLLARARADFPHGALAEEREALTVRALLGAGESDAARLRGEAFLRRFPRSPQAGDVRRLLGLK
jgi:hypothetical protein